MYEAIEVKGDGRRRFFIVLPHDKGRFATDVADFFRADSRYQRVPHVGVLALDYLNGAGSLIDVGANLGLLSIPAAVYGSRVLAIELLPENCLCLSLAVLKNRLRNLVIFPFAAGEAQRLAAGAGSEAWGRIVDPGQGIPVMMLPLDDIVALAELQGGGRWRRFVRRPVLVKIDTEGYELAVLDGAARLIERFDPAFIVESIMIEGGDDPLNTRARAVKERLEAHGYHLYLHRDRRLVPHRARDWQPGHVCDIFASRKRYRDGDRIGRFTVGPLTVAESVRWIAEMIDYPYPAHRMHAAGIIARWRAEGCAAPELADFAERLIRDPDTAVAARAARLLGPAGAG